VTCADALKKAIIRIDKLLQEKKTKMVLPIHDELIFAMAEGEDYLKDELRQVMIDAFEWCLLPVSVGLETTATNWREAG